MRFIYLLLLMFILPAVVDAAQLGGITSEVNFRKGPDRSAPVIARLPAGTEVEVIKLDPAGWYFITYQGRPGFVHKTYIKLNENQNLNGRPQAKRQNLVKPAGLILTGIGVILVAFVVAPDLLLTGIFLVFSLVLVAASDLLFDLGLLYSFFYNLFGVFVLFLFFKRKKKDRAVLSDQISPRKAA